MALRFLQANINHCARAQDLLFQSLAERLINVAVVAEPYYVPSGNEWVGDRDGLVAIVSRSAVGSPAFGQAVKGRGFVAAFIRDVLVVGAYFSPNRALVEFEQFLVEIGALIGRSRPCRVLVVGDLNAKSTAWGSPATDARGEALEEWAVLTGLEVLNRGSVHTCVRQQGGSIVDVTFADSILARRVSGWEVLQDEETLSDHRYIRFEVSSIPAAIRRVSRPLPGDSPRWAVKRLDREVLIEAALVQAWLPALENPVEEEAEYFGQAMSQ
ncbi:uncharacterized protein LOC120635182, partial [Pararge aegeria]|uniref:uncharacterized protein LOC120635182 n=1 Tax=Pararge aegeria TaxID=116150 RepID=UPI0019D177A3